MTLAAKATQEFRTLLACVKCGFAAVIDPPSHHPPCPECGAPVRLTTQSVDSGAVAERVGSGVKGGLLTIEGAVAELRAFVVGLAERITPEARDFFTYLGAEIEHLPGDIRAHIERMRPTKPADPPSNVGEVIHSLDGPTIVTEPPAELPPGSA